jgi:hypothetical protein
MGRRSKFEGLGLKLIALLNFAVLILSSPHEGKAPYNLEYNKGRELEI